MQMKVRKISEAQLTCHDGRQFVSPARKCKHFYIQYLFHFLSIRFHAYDVVKMLKYSGNPNPESGNAIIWNAIYLAVGILLHPHKPTE